MLSDKTLEYGKLAMTAILGVDALYRAETGDEDGLACLNMDLEGEFKPDAYASYAEASEYWTALRSKAADLPEADRRKYYDQLCHSTLAFMKWRSEGLPFENQLTDFLHVPAAPASDEELDSLRGEMRGLLNQMGYSGDLAAQCEAWQEKNRVKPDEIPEIIQSLLDEAWDRTEKYLLKIPAPKSDAMKVIPVSGMPFNARCNYLERKIELNTDPIMTLPGLKHLAVHEGCPGHYVQFKLRETAYRDGTGPADNLLSVVNTASSCLFEGIADTGLEMLEWIESDDDRFSALMGRYRSGIGTAAAWRLNALGWKIEDVADWTRSVALVGGEGWVANRMGFITASSRAALISSYWWGEQSVAPVWRRVPVERRPAFLKFMYGRMHSHQTLAMFE